LFEQKLLKTVLYPVFKWILIILYSIIMGGSILGLLNIYKTVYVIIGSVLIPIILYKIWSRNLALDIISEANISSNQDERSNFNLLNISGYILAGALLLLIIVPVLNWPMNTLDISLNWDAGLYHFPKAVEMWKSGSVWDFTIPYGDYPYGYEILLGFNLMLSKDTSLFSVTHAIILILFILSTWLLSIRSSKLPKGLLLFAIIILILSGFPSVFNPWAGLRGPVYTIGKNDLFLSAVTLSAILFVPFDRRREIKTDWVGLGISSGLAMSIKPNSGLILLFLWIYALFSVHPRKWKEELVFPGMILAALGGNWIIRNFIELQQLFNPNNYRIVQWSIWSNMLNPGFYQHIPKELLFTILIVLTVGVFAIIKRDKIRVWDIFLFLIILFSFLITPASSSSKNPAVIAWRFGLVLLIMQFVYLISLLEPINLRVFIWAIKNRVVSLIFIIILIIPTLVFYFYLYDILRLVPDKASILERPYELEDTPYLSVFDYAHENIHDSVIWVEGSLGYYAYDNEYTNTVSHKRDADYIIVVDRPLEDLWFDITEWELLYQDSRGHVFKNPLKFEEN